MDCIAGVFCLRCQWSFPLTTSIWSAAIRHKNQWSRRWFEYECKGMQGVICQDPAWLKTYKCKWGRTCHSLLITFVTLFSLSISYTNAKLQNVRNKGVWVSRDRTTIRSSGGCYTKIGRRNLSKLFHRWERPLLFQKASTHIRIRYCQCRTGRNLDCKREAEV